MAVIKKRSMRTEYAFLSSHPISLLFLKSDTFCPSGALLGGGVGVDAGYPSFFVFLSFFLSFVNCPSIRARMADDHNSREGRETKLPALVLGGDNRPTTCKPKLNDWLVEFSLSVLSSTRIPAGEVMW